MHRLCRLRPALFLFGLAALACPARGDEVDGKQLYEQVLRSCVCVASKFPLGSGWVADRDRKLVVTSRHVVGHRELVEVLFPCRRQGKLVAEAGYYDKEARRYPGKVIHTSRDRDLALVQLDELPPEALPLKLAGEGAGPGQRVHLIGCPGASQGMWLYSHGTVRQVFHRRFKLRGLAYAIDARIGESQLPANRGDSGGPVVNDRGELVGVEAGVTPPETHLLSTHIDVSEVRAFLAETPRGAGVVTADDFHERGKDYLDDAKWDLAITALNQAIKLNPKKAAYYRDRGLALGDKGNLIKALADYHEAVRLEPDNAEGYGNRAWIFNGLRMYKEAIADCDRALRLDDKDAFAWRERAYAWNAEGAYDKALADCDQALKLKPKEAATWVQRAHAGNGRREYDKALADCDQALKLDPKSSAALVERAEAWVGREDYDRALADCGEAVRLNPRDGRAFHLRAVCANHKKQYDKALADCDRALKLQPGFGGTYRERARALAGKKEHKRALADLSKALWLNSRDVEAYLDRSRCHAALGDPERARKDVEQAARLLRQDLRKRR
jgi:tetratricopeptide (TPR) repeat protein